MNLKNVYITCIWQVSSILSLNYKVTELILLTKVTKNAQVFWFAMFQFASELDKTCEGLPTSSSGSLSLGNTGLLSLDPIEDKTALYDKVLDTYDWHEKVLMIIQF